MSASSEVCLLVGLVKETMPGSVVGCVENIINTLVFVRLHLFTYLVHWMTSS